MRSAAVLLFASTGSAYTLHEGTAGGKKIAIAGDSWGNVVGGYLGQGAFLNKLKEHNCKPGLIENIAVPGTTASVWAGGTELEALTTLVGNNTDYVWLTLMGNDAQGFCPECARKGKSAEECSDELIKQVTPEMEKILEATNKANPNTRIVGFGYDIMFANTGVCSEYPRLLFPQCFKGNGTTEDHRTCFNTQFLKIQGVWDTLKASGKYPNLDVINILGSCQVAGGDKAASVGHPDLTQFNKAGYFTMNMQCIHPSISIPPKDTDGAMIVMESFYKQYWSKELGC